MFSTSGKWKLAKRQVGIVLEYLRRDAIGILLRHILKLSQKLFEAMQLEFALTQFGIVLDYSRLDAIGTWKRHNLELS